MKAAKLPKNEDKRLSVLHQSQMLDSIREDSFDAITMITAQTCDMPMALICLVDADRVWFKSQQGIEGVSEIQRDIGFCSHTITQSELLEIKDARTDDRFFDNPLVTQHNYNYYAGTPLITVDGYALGTLCVMDKNPRELSEDHKEFIRRMAFTVTALIEARINENKTPALNAINKELLETKTYIPQPESTSHANVFIIDEDDRITNSLAKLFSHEGLAIEIYSSPKQFLKSYRNQPGCIVSETTFSNSSGLSLQEEFKEQDIHIPIIYLTGHADIATSVSAMKAGAIDFFEKPLDEQQLLTRVNEAINIDKKLRECKEKNKFIIERLATLTAREKEIMALLVSNRAKLSNKDIAARLSISRRTVEVHRSTVMAKMLASSRLELLEFAEICGLPTD